jgi:hypothetical protein
VQNIFNEIHLQHQFNQGNLATNAEFLTVIECFPHCILWDNSVLPSKLATIVPSSSTLAHCYSVSCFSFLYDLHVLHVLHCCLELLACFLLLLASSCFFLLLLASSCFFLLLLASSCFFLLLLATCYLLLATCFLLLA